MTDLVEELKKQQKLYSDKKKEIEYLNVYTQEVENSLNGAYFFDTDRIMLYTSGVGKQNKSEIELTSTLVHENGHDEINHLYHLGMSPEEIHKLNKCDEISQNMRMLLYRRNEYLKTGDINVLNDVNGNFSFYKKAIESGEISPIASSQDKESFDKEMSLIMNGTMDMWNKKYEEAYETQLDGVSKEYFIRVGEKAQSNPKNYNKAVNEMLTIGGVNFNDYRQKDFTCNSEFAKHLTEVAKSGDKEQISHLQNEFKKEIKATPVKDVRWRDRRKGYVTKYDSNAKEELEANSGILVITPEAKIKNLENLGLLDGSEEDQELIKSLGCDKASEVHYTNTPETKEIPDVSDDNFIKQPTKESKLAERLQELRGLKSGEKSIGGGAASLLNKNRFVANDIQMQKAINDKIKYAR